MALPLANIRVLDFTIMMQGPYATQMLGDMGAEIIKVERPEAPGPAGLADERYGAHLGYGRDKEESRCFSSSFLAFNRNKKSITVDLKKESGKEIVRRLIGVSDVVYENFRPGAMSRLGLGYEDCCKINPSIIYASATGYGPGGPYAQRPGQDMLAQALGGFAVVNASADGSPVPIGFSICDLLGAMNGAFAVVAALYHRQASVEGQQVNVCLLDSTIAAQTEQGVHFLNTGTEPQRVGPMQGLYYIPPPYGVYRTADGYLALAAFLQIPALSRVLGVPNLEGDPRFASLWQRDENRAEMEALVQEILGQRTTAEWLALMEKEDLWAAPVKSFPEAFSDPQVRHNEMVVTVDSPVGPLKLLGVPYKLSKTPAQVRTAPPILGQHTDEVLRSLGYSQEEIDALRQDGTI